MATEFPITRKISVLTPAVAQGASHAPVLFEMPFLGNITSVTFYPSANITGAATNNRTYGLCAVGESNVFALTMDNGVNATASTAKAIPVVSEAITAFAEGTLFNWKSTHNSSGIADPGGLVVVEIERDSEAEPEEGE